MTTPTDRKDRGRLLVLSTLLVLVVGLAVVASGWVPWPAWSMSESTVVDRCTGRVTAAMAYWRLQGREPVAAERLMDACLLYEVTGSTR